MSDALNKQFIAKRISFLVDNCLSVPAPTSDSQRGQKVPDQGLHTFDLNHETRLGRKCIGIRPSGPDADSSSAYVRGYWLPFKHEAATNITLGNEAEFFFTAELSGCQVVISGSSTNPKVVHIAGDLTSRERQAKARPHLTANSRRLSSTQSHHPDVPAYQPDTDDMEADELTNLWANVIGFRGANGVPAGTWEFWYQIVVSKTSYKMDKFFPV